MLARIALSVAVVLVAVLPAVPGPATAEAGDGVGVFHDRVVKRDPAGDVSGDRTTPIDIRRVTYDHHKLGDNERLTITVRFVERLRQRSYLRWGTSTGAGGYPLELSWKVGSSFVLKRDGVVVPRPRARLEVDGREATITIPWRKLGSPGKLVGLSFLATRLSGTDLANKPNAVLR